VECIGKGKAAAPYEFGVKASIVTNNRRAPGGLFVLHARAMPDNPYDGRIPPGWAALFDYRYPARI
jgi:IS5 family transposase